jgi:glycosyltransferase involved in cell wall biosynthesis
MTKRPVVALVCDVIYPYSHGGRELRYRELLPRLAEHVDVNVYTMHWWDGPPVYRNDGVSYHAISRLVPLYTNERRSIWQAMYFGLACLRLLRCDFDLLEADHIPYFQVLVLRLVASLKRKPFTVTWHEVWSRSYWCEYLGWTGWIAWSIEWLAMRLPDQIIAASPQTADRLRQALGARASITTVPNGIDLNGIRNAYPDVETSDLVVVGRLLKHKRIDMLLDVVAFLKARGTHVTCRVIGDGPERAALKEQAITLGIADAVEFLHDVDEQKELYAKVKAAKVFVSLSEREGFGIAVLEAIACAVPVLTTSTPDNLAQNLVERYSRGVVSEPRLPAIAAAVQKLLSESVVRTDDEGSIDSWVADYDWRAIAERVTGAYFK